MRYIIGLLLVALTGCATPAKHGGGESQAQRSAKIHAELGYGYYSQGQLAVSLEEFNESIRNDAGFALPYAGLGLVHAALNQDDLAESNFKRALQLDPQNSETHNNYGAFLCSRNRVDESIKEFLSAVKNPLYATPEMAYLNAGVCALKKKDDKNAEAYLTNALQLQPSLRQAHFQLANLYFGKEDFYLARQSLQRAMLNIDPTPDMLWLGVRIEKNLGGGDTEASYRMLLKNKYPDSPQTKAMLSGE